MSTDLLIPLAVLWGLGSLLWVASLRLRDTSIVDLFWGPMFVVIAGVGYLQGGGLPARKAMVLGFVAVWGLRLAVHLAVRSRGRGEDYRYREMRAKYGSRWWIVSLPYVFLLQATLAWVVALPVQAAVRRGGDAPLSALDLAGALLFVLGFVMEAAADRALARFRSRPENRDRVLDRGLFRYTRHPNYFGDAVVWWGLGLIGVAAGVPWAVVGSAVMTLLLMRVSGVTLLERTIGERRPGYAEYRRTTNAFFPGPPRNSKTC
jgi:steroid 5-alpha reductase family enzyme